MAEPSDYEYRPADGLRTAVIVLLGLTIAVAAIGALLSVREIWLISAFQALPNPTPDSADALTINETVAGGVGVIQFLLFLVTVVPFLMLVHRVTANAWSFQSSTKTPDYSPGWAVGYFFIPILNLIRPAQVMNQNFRLSEPGRRAGVEPMTPNLWWCAWIFGGLAGRVYLGMSGAAEREGDLDLFKAAEVASIVSDLLAAAAGVAAILMFRDLAARQAAAVAAGAGRRAALETCADCGEPLAEDAARCGVCGAPAPAFA